MLMIKCFQNSIICLVAALLLLLASQLQMLQIKKTDYFDNAIEQAAVAYGTVRVINAAVSVIQNSQLQVQPAGVGLSLAIGQVLDPLDDMAERASDVLVVSIAALGVQKLLYELGDKAITIILIVLLITLAIVFGLPKSQLAMLKIGLFKLMLILLLLRLLMPVMLWANAMLEQQFFQPRIEQTKEQLSISETEQDISFNTQQQKQQSTWQLFQRSTQNVQKQAQVIKQNFEQLTERASQLVQSLLTLCYLYIAQFLIQIFFWPLCLFWMAKAIWSYPSSRSQTEHA